MRVDSTIISADWAVTRTIRWPYQKTNEQDSLFHPSPTSEAWRRCHWKNQQTLCRLLVELLLLLAGTTKDKWNWDGYPFISRTQPFENAVPLVCAYCPSTVVSRRSLLLRWKLSTYPYVQTSGKRNKTGVRHPCSEDSWLPREFTQET